MRTTKAGDGALSASGACLTPTGAERRPNPGSIPIMGGNLKMCITKAGDGNRTHVSSLEG